MYCMCLCICAGVGARVAVGVCVCVIPSPEPNYHRLPQILSMAACTPTARRRPSSRSARSVAPRSSFSRWSLSLCIENLPLSHLSPFSSLSFFSARHFSPRAPIWKMLYWAMVALLFLISIFTTLLAYRIDNAKSAQLFTRVHWGLYLWPAGA